MRAQSRFGSLAEAFQNVVVGYAIQTAATYFLGRFFHMHPSVGDVLGFGLVMTAISIARTYGVRRWNEYRRGKKTPPDFLYIVEELAAERTRQIAGEGYDLAHDDAHVRGELAEGTAAYALASALAPDQYDELRRAGIESRAGRALSKVWAWRFSDFKPTRPRRDLIKAGAMLIAEIGRIDRAAKAGRSDRAASHTPVARSAERLQRIARYRDFKAARSKRTAS